MGEVVVVDIRRYLERALYQVRKDLHLPDSDQRWFNDHHLDILAGRAGSSLLYAATVVRFIRSDLSSAKAQLETFIEQKPSEASPYAVLDAVYLEIVRRFLGNPPSAPNSVRPYYTEVVGSMLFLRDLLTVKTIAELTMLDTDDVITTLWPLQPLQSIITQINNVESSVSFYHASFYDFATSDRCLEPVLPFSPKEREAYLAERCLVTMTRTLRENTADIQASTADVSTMPGLARRIPSEVVYAARFWGSHLRGSTRIEDRDGLTWLTLRRATRSTAFISACNNTIFGKWDQKGLQSIFETLF